MANQQKNKSSVDSTTLVILGATGDLSTSKLFPALLALHAEDELPEQFRVLGVSRQELSDDAFRAYLQEEVDELAELSADEREKFLSSVQFESGDVTKPGTYEVIHDHLQQIDNQSGVCFNKLFYLALPPRFYTEVGKKFDDSELMSLCQQPDSWLRVLVEKPYGTDLKTAHRIDNVLCETFASDQLFRIDHYLAKQALQNVVTLRFRNQLFSGSWNGEYIDRIHVKMYETSTIDDRGGFYDQIGAFRDVGQNHILQMLAAATMEPPEDETPEAIRAARANLLADLEVPQTPQLPVVRGQYEGYTQEGAIPDDSQTETYFRVPALIANDRWRNVPITLESGKGLQEDRVEIEISYRESPFPLHATEPITGNTMILEFKPNRGVVFDVWTESPELDTGIQHQTVDFSFSAQQEDEPSAYTTLLYQALQGDQVMFANNREVTASWEFTESVVERLSQQHLQMYSVGSAGPQTDSE